MLLIIKMLNLILMEKEHLIQHQLHKLLLQINQLRMMLEMFRFLLMGRNIVQRLGEKKLNLGNL